MKYKEHIDSTMETLKDFQKATVKHVLQKMHDGQKKFLIADEVGLGKTIVARGILAKLYENEYSPKKTFRVVYVCSNQMLAKQNLSKLNFIKESFSDSKSNPIIEYNSQDDRLTSLTYKPKGKENEYRLSIRALTPATSFDNRGRGRSDERVLLYRLLVNHEELRSHRTALKWFLKGGSQKKEKSWNYEIDEAIRFDKKNTSNSGLRPINEEISTKFLERLNTPLKEEFQTLIFNKDESQKQLIDGLKFILDKRNHERKSFNYGNDVVIFKKYYGLINELRVQLSIVCKDYLKADLFILDEFQRFNQLIEVKTENEGQEIAQAIFNDENARVLLLSATPFKPFTNNFDEHHGENHYHEFKNVLRFLYQTKSPQFWTDLDNSNNIFFNGIKNFASQEVDKKKLLQVKQSIEEIYTQCMARTERILVEEPSLAQNKRNYILTLDADDIEDYIAIDKIVQESNKVNNQSLPQPIEYVKSAPFPLSFLQDYDHHKQLKQNFGESLSLRRLIHASKRAFVPFDRIKSYKALLPERSINEPNPKLRLLYDETIRNNGYKLLWIPPSVKYYQPRTGVYHNTEDFTKTLIFSAWKMVPRMVSALVSYEAERLSIGKLLDQENLKEKYNYNDHYPTPLLRFRNTKKEFSEMNNILISYPSIYLSSLYDPKQNIIEKKHLRQIREELKSEIYADLINAGALEIGEPDGDFKKWNWFSLLLLDINHAQSKELTSWIISKDVDSAFNNDNETDNRKNETHKTAKTLHFNEIKRVLTGGKVKGLGKINKDQLRNVAEYLTELCLGSPGVCSLRAIESVYSSASFKNKMTAALNIGMGFTTMFNKPESIALIKTIGKDEQYYQNVISYSIDGNIQAMLDEFMYQIADSGGESNCIEASKMVKDILSVSRSTISVMTPKSLNNDKKHFSIRTHYAVPFGTSSSANLKNGKREIKVREAFNSPFRPFVLTSTSIGQEGLDFHYYCKKIIHWNLPNNPIDLEQREGRIKRYKSHLIRINTAKLYKESVQEIKANENIWDKLFELAEKNKESNVCDLVPFWHINTENNTIDNIIPIYPFSKDISKLEHIKKVLRNYRLTFGHPNQQDLIDSISELPEESQNELKSFLINLSPLLK